MQQWRMSVAGKTAHLHIWMPTCNDVSAASTGESGPRRLSPDTLSAITAAPSLLHFTPSQGGLLAQGSGPSQDSRVLL